MSEGRWTREPAGGGDDPRQTDAEQYDEETVRRREQTRPLTDDQDATGEQGVSSDKPGVDGGGYPEEPPDRGAREARGGD